MGPGLTARHYSSRQNPREARRYQAKTSRAAHWSKIGAEPALNVLRRVSVVNPVVFRRLLQIDDKAGNFRHIQSVHDVRVCDTRVPPPFRSNHGGGNVRACVRAGPDIAKLAAVIVDHVDEWIADELLFGFFSRESLCAGKGPRGCCSFWDSRAVRPVSFCDGANSLSRKVR
jgi:hypothetical protein